jgi:cell wall-associated NlpC family hydrolase
MANRRTNPARPTARLVQTAATLAAAAALLAAGAAVASADPADATPSATSCATTGLGDPHGCAQAVSWARAHISTRDNPDYYRRCDHVVGLAYGFAASGSTTAYHHWLAIPGRYRHPGDTSVPAGGLAFFSDGGAGHVMISVGGGRFASNDIHGAGTYTYTTIAEIEHTWGQHYLGWAQPWFQANH